MMTREQAEKWLSEQFEYEYCAECGGDAEDHIVCSGPFGLPFAMCKFTPIVAGVMFRHGKVLHNLVRS